MTLNGKRTTSNQKVIRWGLPPERNTAILKYFLNYATPQNILFHIPELKDTSPF